MTELALFDLDSPAVEAPPRERCAYWDGGCLHPDHKAGTYQRGAHPIWTTTPCHECGEPLARFLRCGHHNLDATAWEHLRAHAYARRRPQLVAMDGRLWVGHPDQVIRRQPWQQ